MTARRVGIAALVLGLAAPPLIGVNLYWLHVLNLTWINTIAVLGLNVATGLAGQIVLGQAALVGVGAYATALGAMRLHLPWGLALAGGIGLTALVGAALGVVSTRIRGHYLAITTLALNEIFRLAVLNEEWLTGGPFGLREIPVVRLAWLDPWLGEHPDHQLYLPLLGLTLAACALTVRVYRTRFGRDMRAVRDDEVAAEAMGVDSRRTKTRAFVLCSVWAALAGGAYALLVGFVSPNNFTIFESIRLLLMAVVGGLGSIAGSLLGAAVVTVLPEALRAAETYYLAAFGIGVVAILLVAPRGLGVVADWLTAPWLAPPGPPPGATDGSALRLRWDAEPGPREAPARDQDDREASR